MKIPKIYQEMLIEELEKRKRANPSYVLKAFAADMGLSVALASGVLNGRKNLSAKRARDVARRLGFSKDKAEFFCDLVEATSARGTRARESARKRVETKSIQNRNNLEIDPEIVPQLKWEHWLTLAMKDMAGYRETPLWISKRLGISIKEAENVLRVLEGHGLLTEESKQKFLLLPHAGIDPLAATRELNRELLKRAERTIDNPSSQRKLHYAIIPVDPEDIDKANTLMWKFQQDFVASMSGPTSGKTHLFALSLQFFGLGVESTTEKIRI